MASFFDEIARNRLKSLALLFLFSLFFMLIIYLFTVLLGGGYPALVFGFVLVLLYAVVVYFTGDKFVLRLSGAKEADEKQYRTLYDIIGGLAAATQTPMPKVYIINDPNPNAFATGRNKKHSSVAATTGLLAMMNRDELEGVLAHEMSHIQDNDIQVMIVAIVFAGAIGIISAFVRNMLFWGGGLRSGERGNAGILLLIALVLGLLAPLFALLIRLAISRRREYMADANGARLTRSPGSLASALRNIQKYTASPQAQPVRHANEITASMYFSNPFKASSMLNLFSTHPPLEDRINKLEHMY